MEPPILVTVVTGFLGAGKSTLLERWLEELPRDQTAVIVNERGDVGIDGTLLARRSLRLREITGGCICCTSQLALDAALAELADARPAPTRILIETSGAASPAGVLRSLTRGTARDRLGLDGVVAVLDASRARRTLQFGLTVEQLGFADVVALSHVDRCAPTDLAALEHDLAPHAPGAVIAHIERGQVRPPSPPTLLGLLATRSDVLRIPPSEDPGIARHGIDAVSLVHDGELDEARLGDWMEDTLGAIEARLLRIKGILAVAGIDERVIVQGVAEAVEVTLGAPWLGAQRTSRLVILGLGLDEAGLREGYAACATGRTPRTNRTRRR